jgi:hypothetical protein
MNPWRFGRPWVSCFVKMHETETVGRHGGQKLDNYLPSRAADSE